MTLTVSPLLCVNSIDTITLTPYTPAPPAVSIFVGQPTNSYTFTAMTMSALYCVTSDLDHNVAITSATNGG